VQKKPLVIDIDDPQHIGGQLIGEMDYEAFLATGDPEAPWSMPAEEWQAISLNYTSGTTGNPKGVVYHHRGAFLNAVGNVMAFGLSAATVYLWTLPMFHCNGWSHTWAVTAAAGTHVCLRRVEPALIFAMIERHRVTHLSGAPIVLNMLVHAPGELKRHFDHTVDVATGGAAPPTAVIANMERMGFRITHLYGLTETFGPATLCAWQPKWSGLPLEQRAANMARQGVPHPMLAYARVVDPRTMHDVPTNGETVGELVLRSNTVMKGYLKNPVATGEALADGWFHTGDLGVMHPNGYIELKDRSKDIIIFCGENISSLEVEEVLFRHPSVMEAAVVARPDDKWGETPCAFVTLKPGESVTAKEIIAFCRGHLALFKVPTKVVFGPLPKTSTGKVQKFVLREQARGA
jgi:fatty-acyl-CoA synthase